MESDPTVKHGKWTESEDNSLRKVIETHGAKNWHYISLSVQGRSAIQCLHRWTKVLKPGIVKGSWNEEEDTKLKQWVEDNGPQKWSDCSRLIIGRSGKQCRERWHNNLDPNIIKGQWTKAEDNIIFDLFNKEGPKWSTIAQALPGRTENSIKNRFYSTIRKAKGKKYENSCKVDETILMVEEMELTKNALALEKFINDYQQQSKRQKAVIKDLTYNEKADEDA